MASGYYDGKGEAAHPSALPLHGVSRHGFHSDLKGSLKEKFVSVLEDIFDGTSQVISAREEGFSGHQSMQRFWDELFLLKVNESYLSKKVAITTEEELTTSLRGTISLLFSTSLRYFEDENFIRVGHALEIFSIVLRGLLQKRFDQQWHTIISLVAGSTEIVEKFFSKLISSVSTLLTRDDSPDFVKSLCLRLILIILSATDKIEGNSMASFIFINNIFDPIYKIISSQSNSAFDHLQFDSVLILVQLISWRRAENIYMQKLCSLSIPELIVLLNTISNLLSIKETPFPFSPSKMNFFLAAEKLTGKDSNNLVNTSRPDVSSASDVGFTSYFLAYVSSLTGLGERFMGGAKPVGTDVLTSPKLHSPKSEQNIKDAFLSEKRVAEVSSALLLLYFLLHKNQTMKTNNIWSGSNLSLVSSWSNTLNVFFRVLKNILSINSVNETGGLVRQKLCFIIFRLLLELNSSFDFLIHNDISNSEFTRIPPGNGGCSPLSNSGMVNIIAKHILKFLDIGSQSISDPNFNVDPEVFELAISDLAILFNKIRKQKLSLNPSFFDFPVFWRSLIRICKWCSEDSNFQKNKVIDLANLSLDFFESFLGYGSEIVSRDEIEKLHAVILENFSVFEKLWSAVLKFSSLYGPEWKLEEKMKLVNLKEVNSNYELQLVSQYGNTKPTESQILSCVKKTGFENLKLKFRHVGPAYNYTDGTAENQIMDRLLTQIVVFLRKYFSLLTPKFELESL